MKKIRILIVDDHAILREGIKALLAQHEDMEVVGEAEDGSRAIEKVDALRPDVVLLDIAMPKLGGLEATFEIADKTKVIILTQYDTKEYVYRFLRAGVSGYILKKALGSELATAIRSVNKGEMYIDPSVATDVVKGFLSGKGEDTLTDPYEKLSDREKQVLKLVAESHTSKEIAEILQISFKTVMSHRTNIMEKLQIHSKTELVKFAMLKGII